MTRLWLGVAVGSSEAPLPYAWLAGGQVCFFGCKGSDCTCSHMYDVVGRLSSLCMVTPPVVSPPTVSPSVFEMECLWISIRHYIRVMHKEKELPKGLTVTRAEPSPACRPCLPPSLLTSNLLCNLRKVGVIGLPSALSIVFSNP